MALSVVRGVSLGGDELPPMPRIIIHIMPPIMSSIIGTMTINQPTPMSPSCMPQPSARGMITVMSMTLTILPVPSVGGDAAELVRGVRSSCGVLPQPSHSLPSCEQHQADDDKPDPSEHRGEEPDDRNERQHAEDDGSPGNERREKATTSHESHALAKRKLESPITIG
jgi:hypothetical protein